MFGWWKQPYPFLIPHRWKSLLCWQTPASPKSQHPPLSTSTWLPRFWNFCSMLKLRCYQVPPCFLFSISSCSCLSLHSWVSNHVYISHCVFFSDFWYPQLMLCSLTLYIRFLFMYVIWYVWILTLTIVFIVYSTSGHPTSLLNFQLPDAGLYKYSDAW